MQIALSDIPTDFHEKTAVMHAVDKPLEDITVDYICKRCGISRSKFYELFQSKYDIGYWYLNLVYDLTLGKIGTELSWRDGIMACLELMDQERVYFKYTARTPEKVPNLYWAIRADRVSRVEEALTKRGMALTEKLRVEIGIYSEVTDLLLRRWVEGTTELSIDEFADLWLDCIPRELYAVFDVVRS